jgi:acetyltransferase-like isoleucine patch superfamily enzyme
MKLFVRVLVPVMSLAIVGVPTAATLPLVTLGAALPVKLLAWAIAPAVFAITYVLTAGALSLPFQRAIVAGTFPRSLAHAVYGPRRLYGLCWTAVYYSGPIYQLALTIPIVKRAMLRLFGYRGGLDVTVYADTWIRDLPLLRVGKGAYLSNKATIGTNICLASGDILVDTVEVRDGALVGHLAMLGPGCVIGEKAEIGVGCGIGIKAMIGAGSRVAPNTTVYHGARIGKNVQIGSMVFIGACVRIADGLCIPSGARIPDRAVLRTEADVRALVAPAMPMQAPALAA